MSGRITPPPGYRINAFADAIKGRSLFQMEPEDWLEPLEMKAMSAPEFECDLEPETRMPRVRFNFPNGWSASLLIRTGQDLTRAMLASVAACPTARWQDGVTELVGHELSAVEAVAALDMIAARPPVEGADA